MKKSIIALTALTFMAVIFTDSNQRAVGVNQHQSEKGSIKNLVTHDVRTKYLASKKSNDSTVTRKFSKEMSLLNDSLSSLKRERVGILKRLDSVSPDQLKERDVQDAISRMNEINEEILSHTDRVIALMVQARDV